MPDREPLEETPLDRLRSMVAEYEERQRTLPALLADVRHEIVSLGDDDPLRQRVAAALSALGRAWGGAPEGLRSTWTIDRERTVHEAIAELKRALELE
ncbi:MAG TPA: hypothetical protein VLA66_00660 [Thermoanaerobaculia bacterium]|nr:hypothetical protein [Thermoanaerobaculia bacterium]